MTKTTATPIGAGRGEGRLRLGFMPLVDCAPLVVARDLGFATDEGLQLELVRETSWANIRDRLVLGHFDAAHMLAPMPIAARLGLGHLQAPVIAPFVLDQGGNSIAVTTALWREGGDWGGFGDPLASGRTLARIVAERAKAGREQLTFASVHPFSCHHHQLRHWMAAAGVDPDRDVRLTVVPPPYMVAAMEAGEVDGVCVGAPWTSRAVDSGIGHIVLPTAVLWPSTPEKVLGLRADLAERRGDEIEALLRALDRAAAWAEAPENRGELADLLARDEVVGVPAAIVMRSLTGRLQIERGGQPVSVPGFLRFHGEGVNGPINRPRPTDGLWFAAQMLRWHQTDDAEAAFAAAREAFASDRFDRAIGRPSRVDDTLRTFDGPLFDGGDPEKWLRTEGWTGAGHV
jgi:NitT/TauT family transport system ATP-binding protein